MLVLLTCGVLIFETLLFFLMIKKEPEIECVVLQRNAHVKFRSLGQN